MKELAKVREELAKSRKENEELSRSLAATQRNEGFAEARCSTMQEGTEPGNEVLLTTMNNMSLSSALSSITIPECMPAPGDTELNKKGYDHWKNVFNSTMNITQTTDETTKLDMFRIKAGSLLLELLDGTSTQPGMPNERLFPYSNAIARLDGYFVSRPYILSQRNRLANMVQKKDEGNIEYVRRVAAASKQFNYKPDEEFEAISRTVTRGAGDSRVRILAYRVLTDGGALNELIDQVRIREVEMENEDDYRRLHQQKTATIAAVYRQPNDYGQNRRRYPTNRGRDGPVRTQRHTQVCWRCRFGNHTPEECIHRDTACHNCGRRGHIARACSSRSRQGPQKRRWTGEESGEPPSKMAAVQKVEVDKEEMKVMEDNVE